VRVVGEGSRLFFTFPTLSDSNQLLPWKIDAESPPFFSHRLDGGFTRFLQADSRADKTESAGEKLWVTHTANCWASTERRQVGVFDQELEGTRDP